MFLKSEVTACDYTRSDKRGQGDAGSDKFDLGFRD